MESARGDRDVSVKEATDLGYMGSGMEEIAIVSPVPNHTNCEFASWKNIIMILISAHGALEPS